MTVFMEIGEIEGRRVHVVGVGLDEESRPTSSSFPTPFIRLPSFPAPLSFLNIINIYYLIK